MTALYSAVDNIVKMRQSIWTFIDYLKTEIVSGLQGGWGLSLADMAGWELRLCGGN